MKALFFISALLISSFILFSCKKDNPVKPKEQNQATINLSLEDISCTEAWIKLTTSNLSLPMEIRILKDNTLSEIINLTVADTILYVDSLLPKKTYNFISIIHSNNQIIKDSVSVATMDTTSHNFNWQTYTFGGQAGTCVLNDVAIIDENNIWAVGVIYMLDTLGQADPKAYNVVHWDGSQWKLLRLQFYTICGQPHTGSYPAKSILAFSENDIWISSGSQVTHFNGETQSYLACIPVSVNKLWGTNDNDIYAVGNSGNIAHYQNGQWSSIESGTDLNINDIYGAYNETSKKYEILAPAANVLQSLDRELLTIVDNSVEQLNTTPIAGTLRTAWFIPNRIYFIGGGGIFKKASLKDPLWNIEYNGVTVYSINRIRGIAINDITLTGGGGEILHYNGLRFKSYLSQTQINGNYYSLDTKDNIIVAVGIDNPKAVITMGRRN